MAETTGDCIVVPTKTDKGTTAAAKNAVYGADKGDK